ncbi:hypothetical protein GFS31_17690 [Leptolyngbya sp. BL0902]|nr:hypothetical protein GFS31_17690 [Leptolyngbya sp. BL0902]
MSPMCGSRPFIRQLLAEGKTLYEQDQTLGVKFKQFDP